MRNLLLTFLFLIGCKHDTTEGYFCPAERPLCPAGYKCIDECCGGPPCGSNQWMPDYQSPDTDLRSVAAADLLPGAADLGLDKNTPPTSIDACRLRVGLVGWQLTPKVAACQAANIGASSTCNDLLGWSPCEANQLPGDLCGALLWGFFGSNAHGRQPVSTMPDSSMIFTWQGGGPTSTEQRFVYGCGKANAVVTWDVSSNPDGGFTRAVPCHGNSFSAPSSWDCPYNDNSDQDARAVIADPMDGELCCHS